MMWSGMNLIRKAKERIGSVMEEFKKGGPPTIEGGMTAEERAIFQEMHSDNRWANNPNEIVVGQGGTSRYLLQEIRQAAKWLDRVFVFDPSNDYALTNANYLDPTTTIEFQQGVNIINLSQWGKEKRTQFAVKTLQQVEQAFFSSRYEKVAVYIDGLDHFDEPSIRRLYEMSRKSPEYHGFLCIAMKSVPELSTGDISSRLFWNARYYSIFSLDPTNTERLEKESLISSSEVDRLRRRRKNDPFLQIVGSQRYWRSI